MEYRIVKNFAGIHGDTVITDDKGVLMNKENCFVIIRELHEKNIRLEEFSETLAQEAKRENREKGQLKNNINKAGPGVLFNSVELKGNPRVFSIVQYPPLAMPKSTEDFYNLVEKTIENFEGNPIYLSLSLGGSGGLTAHFIVLKGAE